LLEDGIAIRAAGMPVADDLMMRVYAAMAQKERELILERSRAALAAAQARGKALGDVGIGQRARMPRRRRRRSARWPSGRRTSCSSTWSGCALRASRASGTGAGSQRARRADAARSRCLDAHDGSEPEGAIE